MKKQVDRSAKAMAKMLRERAIQAMVTVLDFIGFSTSPIDPLCFPARPYLKAYISGQMEGRRGWEAITPPLWKAHGALPMQGVTFTWQHLSTDHKPFAKAVKIRVFQDLIFDVVDAASDLTVAQARVNFDEMLFAPRDPEDNMCVTLPVGLRYLTNFALAPQANQKAVARGLVRLRLDTREEAFAMPKLSDDYWETGEPPHPNHQAQHWTQVIKRIKIIFSLLPLFSLFSFPLLPLLLLFPELTSNQIKLNKMNFGFHFPSNFFFFSQYPIPPIGVGVVRQSYQHVSKCYDRMMVVHPAFFGFRVRYRGIEKFESNFIHPTFSNFSLLKTSLSKKQLADIELNTRRALKVPPFFLLSFFPLSSFLSFFSFSLAFQSLPGFCLSCITFHCFSLIHTILARCPLRFR
jgi:hypothetical protein